MSIPSEVTTAALVALVALLCGGVMTRLRQSPIVGYILAGVLLGPSGFELVKSRDGVGTLAEFGVLLLLFVVGMELDLRRFVAQWKVAVFATLFQILGSLGAAFALHNLLGWSIGLTVLSGFVVAISSTAVVIKTLAASSELDSPAGRTTVAILIAQDMAVVPMMLVMNALASRELDWSDVATVAGSLVFLVAFLWFLVRRPFPLPWGDMLARNPDLSPLAGMALCCGAATLCGLLDLSPAYGAFLAGIAIGNSGHREGFLSSMQPVQALLLMAFFVSIGLLLDIAFLWAHLGTVLVLLGLVTIFQTGLNILSIRVLGPPWPQAMLSGVALAQIGEFAFVLTQSAKSSHLITNFEAKTIIAVTVLSLALSPLWLITVRRLHRLADSAVFTSPRALLAEVYRREADVMAEAARRLLLALERLRRPKGPALLAPPTPSQDKKSA